MVIFDLDGTLAEQGEPVGQDASEALRSLERRGVQVVLCSGKPAYYLVGVARQLGLKDVAVIGETGFTVQVGSGVPPRAYHEMEVPPETRTFMQRVVDAVRREGSRVWLQPNLGSVTVFFYDDDGQARMRSLLTEMVAGQPGVLLFEQPDCFDVTPGVTKADGIRWLMDWASMTEDDVIYVGDGENDQPAFDLIPFSIAIDPDRRLRARTHVDTLDQALAHVAEATDDRGVS
jgi:hydroxymethylpyrimidine pyrophosphatase-like HAD family hydrolase